MQKITYCYGNDKGKISKDLCDVLKVIFVLEWIKINVLEDGTRDSVGIFTIFKRIMWISCPETLIDL